MTAVTGYLDELSGLLWPATGDGPGPDDLILLPNTRAPRLLVPAGRRAGAAALRTYGEPGSLRSMLATRALAAFIGSGIGGVVLRDRLCVGAPSIQTYLSELVGQPVQISLHLRANRANRKPVLQLLTRDGHVVGVAKIGINPLTADLVRAERSALATVNAARPASFAAPTVLASATWNGLEVLVLSPLPVWLRRARPRPGQLDAAAAEVAAIVKPRAATLPASEFWQRLKARLAAAGDRDDHRALSANLGLLADRAGATELTFGTWHGDWVPWNMAFTRQGLLIWDWERFAAGVPLGFDALHHWLQRQVASDRTDPAAAAAECVQRAPELVGSFGVDPAKAQLTALAYLAELSVRYLADKQAEAGARLGAPGRWLIPALTAGLAPQTTPTGGP